MYTRIDTWGDISVNTNTTSGIVATFTNVANSSIGYYISYPEYMIGYLPEPGPKTWFDLYGDTIEDIDFLVDSLSWGLTIPCTIASSASSGSSNFIFYNVV